MMTVIIMIMNRFDIADFTLLSRCWQLASSPVQ
jgi:hypothetical protein